MKTKKIALFFGSFNPIHIGHLILANYLVEYSNLDQLWLVVSPHNPHKQKSSLLDDRQRYIMAELACEKYPNIKVSDIEFSMVQPSYTASTLAVLKEKYPHYSFSLIMGEDNLASFNKWKNYQYIMDHHEILVYPRKFSTEEKSPYLEHKNIHQIDAPIIEISSTKIREMIKNKKNYRAFVPIEVFDYLQKTNYYQK